MTFKSIFQQTQLLVMEITRQPFVSDVAWNMFITLGRAISCNDKTTINRIMKKFYTMDEDFAKYICKAHAKEDVPEIWERLLSKENIERLNTCMDEKDYDTCCCLQVYLVHLIGFGHVGMAVDKFTMYAEAYPDTNDSLQTLVGMLNMAILRGILTDIILIMDPLFQVYESKSLLHKVEIIVRDAIRISNTRDSNTSLFNARLSNTHSPKLK